MFTGNVIFSINMSLPLLEEVMRSSLRQRTSCGWAEPVGAAQLLNPIFIPGRLASLHQQSQDEPSITPFDQRAHGQCASLEGSHFCAEWK